jgi:chemotaxis protein CheD
MVKLINDMTAMGAQRNRMKAKIAGGAQMFAYTATNENMRIGDRNVSKVIGLLSAFGIPLLGQDVGADYGRTVELYADDGRFFIKTIGHGNKTL